MECAYIVPMMTEYERSPLTAITSGVKSRPRDELVTEIFRKSIHMMIAMVPALARLSLPLALGGLTAGILAYTLAESLRLRGVSVVLISSVTVSASRLRDRQGFVLGPVTLGIGALLALMLYPLPAAEAAIYALAFGDSAASLAGKFLKSRPLFPLSDKTVAGSLACFSVSYAIALHYSPRWESAVGFAAGVTFIEALPLRDSDNIVIPVGAGLLAALLF